MISLEILGEAIRSTIIKAASELPSDVAHAFEKAIENEKSQLAAESLISTFESCKQAREKGGLLCPDTGWPLFFIKIGTNAKIEGGLLELERVAKEKVKECTQKGYLRPTMVHPITRIGKGDNIGDHIPHFTYKFFPGESLEITFVPKGGGSELFGGTRYRVLAPSDIPAGIKKFVIDAYIQAASAGKICPPSIVGVGIGGTSDICMNLAKEAAVLRPIGSHNRDEEIAKLEIELKRAINELGIGPMGIGGSTSVFSVHIEYAYVHTAGLPVAINANCAIARRATVRIRESEFEFLDDPNWFG